MSILIVNDAKTANYSRQLMKIGAHKFDINPSFDIKIFLRNDYTITL